LIEERLITGKTEKAKVLLYSEKEHEKYTEAEMHESFSTSGKSVRCIFHIKDALSFRIYPAGKSVQGHKGTEDLAKG
jgi:hypothetical protein